MELRRVNVMDEKRKMQCQKGNRQKMGPFFFLFANRAAYAVCGAMIRCTLNSLVRACMLPSSEDSYLILPASLYRAAFLPGMFVLLWP